MNAKVIRMPKKQAQRRKPAQSFQCLTLRRTVFRAVITAVGHDGEEIIVGAGNRATLRRWWKKQYLRKLDESLVYDVVLCRTQDMQP